MKIGIITEYYYPSLGGITEHVHYFSKELSKMGHKPVIITGNAGIDPTIDSGGIEIIRLGKSMPLYSNESIARITLGTNLGRRMKEILRSEKFDIIHIHPPFVPSLPMLAHLYTNTTTVGTFHSQFDSNIFLKTYKRIAQKGIDLLDGRIAVSELCINSVRHYIEVNDYRIIPNGVDTEKFSESVEKIPEYNDDKLNLFFLSRLEPRNGLEYLIKAFAGLRKDRSDCRLIVGGDGPLKNYYESLIPSSIKSDIHFVGRINDARPNFYATADIFCFPTTKASFGITILEAMASAKPVVAFTMPAYETILKDGEEGVLCGPPDVNGLTEALNNLLNSEDARTKIGRNARLRAEEYSWNKVTAQVVDYYEEIKNIN